MSETTSELLLGIDVGSSSIKAVLVNPDGLVVSRAEVPHCISRPHPGWAEQDADADWWNGVVQACAQLDPAAHGRVLGVGIAALGPCLLPADAAGRPVRPAILYGIDRRAGAEIHELDQRLGADDVLRRCGSPLTTQSLGPKMLWLIRHEPETAAKTRLWFTSSSFLVHKLTGEWMLDHHTASQCGPLYDIHTNHWIEEWAAAAAPGLPLPPLRWPQEVAGEVTAEAAEVTGIPAGTPVVAGSIDSWAEVFAAGLRRPGIALLVYGTTLFMIQVRTTASPDRRLWSTTSFEPGERNLAAGMASAGALLRWLSVVSDTPVERLDEEAAEVPPGAGGLVVLPYFNGERTPIFDPDARGVVAGLTVEHTRAHLYRALLESTALGVRQNLSAMAEAGAAASGLLAAGGGSHGKLWMQIVADVTGLEQRILSQSLGASLGAALLGAIGIDMADLGTSWNAASATYRPRTQEAGIYDDLYAVYQELYAATAPYAHTLARLQETRTCLE